MRFGFFAFAFVATSHLGVRAQTDSYILSEGETNEDTHGLVKDTLKAFDRENYNDVIDSVLKDFDGDRYEAIDTGDAGAVAVCDGLASACERQCVSAGGYAYSLRCTTDQDTEEIKGECECRVTEAADGLMFESLSSFLDTLLPPFPQTMIDTLDSTTQQDFFDTLFGGDAGWTATGESDRRGRPCDRGHAQDDAVPLESFLDSARVDALRTQNGYEAMRPVAIIVETQEYELPPWRQSWPKNPGPMASYRRTEERLMMSMEEQHEVCLARAVLALVLALCLTSLLWCCTCRRRGAVRTAASAPLYAPLFDPESGYDSDSAESSGESPSLQEVMCVNPLFRGQTPAQE